MKRILTLGTLVLASTPTLAASRLVSSAGEVHAQVLSRNGDGSTSLHKFWVPYDGRKHLVRLESETPLGNMESYNAKLLCQSFGFQEALSYINEQEVKRRPMTLRLSIGYQNEVRVAMYGTGDFWSELGQGRWFPSLSHLVCR